MFRACLTMSRRFAKIRSRFLSDWNFTRMKWAQQHVNQGLVVLCINPALVFNEPRAIVDSPATTPCLHPLER